MNRRVRQVYITNNQKENLSRTDLVEWVNSLLLSKFYLVEELCTGAAYCQFMDILFPNTVAMHRVKFMTNVENDFSHNFRILKDSFDKVGVEQPIPVEKLIKGRFQDNLHFLQYFKKFYDANWINSGVEYNAVAARKGANMGFGPVVVVKNAARRGQVNTKKRASIPAKPITFLDRTLSPIPEVHSPVKKIIPRLVSVDQNAVDIEQDNDPESSEQLEIIPNKTDHGLWSKDCLKGLQDLTVKIQKLSDELNSMQELVRRTTIRSNFYHSKCLEVEILCKTRDKRGGTLSCDEIYKIIYATKNGFETLTD